MRLKRTYSVPDMDAEIIDKLNNDKVIIWFENHHNPDKWWNLVIFGPFMLVYIIWRFKQICNANNWPFLEYRRAVINYRAEQNGETG